MLLAFITAVTENQERIKPFASFLFSQHLFQVTSIFPEHHLNLNSFLFKQHHLRFLAKDV